MENKNFKPLDMNNLKSKKSIFVSSKESLNDVTPIVWSEEILTGKKKVNMTNYK